MATAPMTAAAEPTIAPTALERPTHMANNNLHRYVKHDPEAVISRSGKWQVFWRVAQVVNALACGSLAAFGLTVAACCTVLSEFAFAGAFAALSICAVFARNSIDEQIGEAKDNCISNIKMATSILAKMNAIPDDGIPNKLRTIGLAEASTLLTKQQCKQLIAHFEYFKNTGAYLRNNAEKGLALHKLLTVYSLHVLMHPDDVRTISAFVSFHIDPTALIRIKTTSGKCFTGGEILAQTPMQLHDMIFGDPGCKGPNGRDTE